MNKIQITNENCEITVEEVPEKGTIQIKNIGIETDIYAYYEKPYLTVTSPAGKLFAIKLSNLATSRDVKTKFPNIQILEITRLGIKPTNHRYPAIPGMVIGFGNNGNTQIKIVDSKIHDWSKK